MEVRGVMFSLTFQSSRSATVTTAKPTKKDKLCHARVKLGTQIRPTQGQASRQASSRFSGDALQLLQLHMRHGASEFTSSLAAQPGVHGHKRTIIGTQSKSKKAN